MTQAPPPAALLDLIGDAVVVCDPGSRRVRECNRAAREFFPRLSEGTALTAESSGPLGEAAAAGEESFGAAFGGRALSGHRHAAAGAEVWLVRDVSALRACADALEAARNRARFLAGSSRRLGASLHPGRTARAVVTGAVPTLAEHALLLVPHGGPRLDWYRADAASSAPEAAAPEAAATGELPAEVAYGMPHVSAALSGTAPRETLCPWHELAGLGGLLPGHGSGGEPFVVPLGGGLPIGALILVRRVERGSSGEEAELVREYASRAGTALAAADFYAQQAHTTAVLRSGMDPQHPPASLGGVQTGVAYRPAREEMQIGGDFYELLPATDGGVEFHLGDVSGRGVEAAVLAGQIRQSLRAFTLAEASTERVLHLLNRLLLERNDTRFTTLVTGRARPAADGGLEVALAGGGHLPPLVLRRHGGVEPVTLDGMLVGAVPDPVFDRARLRLAPGELLLLYSDGITEARGGTSGRELYGEERLSRDLATCAGMPAEAVAERLGLLLSQWLAGPEHDDIALLALRAPGGR